MAMLRSAPGFWSAYVCVGLAGGVDCSPDNLRDVFSLEPGVRRGQEWFPQLFSLEKHYKNMIFKNHAIERSLPF